MSSTAEVARAATTVPLTLRDHAPRTCLGRFAAFQGGGDRGPGRRRATRGRWPARPRRRRRLAWGSASFSTRVTMLADLRLAGPSGPGDRGLDLARRVQAGRDARAGRRPAWPPRRPARCPSPYRTLCWLNTRSTATTSGWCVRSTPRASASICASRRRCIERRLGVRTTPTCTRVRRPAGTPSTTPRPHRVSPGSTPSTRMDRLSSSAEQHVRILPRMQHSRTAADLSSGCRDRLERESRTRSYATRRTPRHPPVADTLTGRISPPASDRHSGRLRSWCRRSGRRRSPRARR